MSKCKIDEVRQIGTIYESPLLAHFQNGSIPPSYANDLDCFLAKDESMKDARIAIAVASDNAYSGVVGKGLLRNFIGIRNKSTKKMRLIEVEECSMLSQHYNEPCTSIAGSRSKEQSLKILLANFGGKNAIKTMERKERMKINVDIVKSQLDKTMNETSNNIVEKDDFDLTQEKREHHLEMMIPPMNKAAKKLDEVFKLTDLIDVQLLVRLESEALEVLGTNSDDIPIDTQYVKDIIKRCQDCKDPDSPENITKIKVCIYIDALINFLRKIRVKYTNMQVVPFSQITEKVETDIRQKFSQPDTVRLVKSNYILQKASCYIIVLSLLISPNYEMEIADIVGAINTPKTGIVKLGNVIPIRGKTATNRMILKLPSQMRTVNTLERKKRRTI